MIKPSSLLSAFALLIASCSAPSLSAATQTFPSSVATPVESEEDPPFIHPTPTRSPTRTVPSPTEGPLKVEQLDLSRFHVPFHSPEGDWTASLIETSGLGVEDRAELIISSPSRGASWLAHAVTERDVWGGFAWPLPLYWSTVAQTLYFTHFVRSDGCLPAWANASDLWSLDLATGQSRPLAPKLGYWIDFAPDERSILYLSHSQEGRIIIRDLATGQDTTIPLELQAQLEDRITFISAAMWSPSGEQIALAYNVDACDHNSTAAVLVDLEDSTQKILIEPFQRALSLSSWISHHEALFIDDHTGSQIVVNTVTGSIEEGQPRQ